jgi:hypothetical protein
MYNYMATLASNKVCSSADGKTKIDYSGFLMKTDSFQSLLSLTYGQALCAPCDVSGLVVSPGDPKGICSKCLCKIPVSKAFMNTVLVILGESTPSIDITDLYKVGIGPEFIILPWSVLRSPDGWNSSGMVYDASGTIAMEICDVSGGPLSSPSYSYDGSKNVLDSSNINVYGGNICLYNVNNLFGGECDSHYYPTGTFSFSFKEVIQAWLYLYQPHATLTPAPPPATNLSYIIFALNKAGYYPARPRTTVDNYLQGINGFHYPQHIRFFHAT